MKSGQAIEAAVNSALTDHHEETTLGNNESDSPEAKLLRRLHANLGSWEKVAARVKLNRGLIWMVAHGKIKSPSVSAKLNRNYRQLWESSDPSFLRLIRKVAVPWLRAKQDLVCGPEQR
ncbi:hypothetical protein MYX84_05170 [Acidobacteria bacterium AH-259-O06]|nr:hypothetical protein [Acidobacteria bacterium AH-259-O06]